MKKYFIGALVSLTLALFISTGCFAAGDVDFGVHIGTGTSHYSGDVYGAGATFSKENTNLGGLYLNFSSPDSCVEIQPELNYVRDRVNTSKFDYIQLPVLLKVNSPEFCNGIKIFTGVGPYASVLLSDDKDMIRQTDYGYILSAGVTVHDTISFEVRHCQGLMDVSSVDGISARNSKNLFLVGFQF